MDERLGLKGQLNLDIVHIDGTTENRFIPNTVLTIGKHIAARNLISGDYVAIDPVGWMSIGTGSNTITDGDTTLGTEYIRYGQTNGSIVGSTTTSSTTNDTARWIGSFGIEDSKTINEAGLFNKSGLDLGSMFARTAFADISAVSGDRINATWDATLS